MKLGFYEHIYTLGYKELSNVFICALVPDDNNSETVFDRSFSDCLQVACFVQKFDFGNSKPVPVVSIDKWIP